MNIITLCENNGIDFKLNTNQKWLNINCPLCGDRKFRGGINIDNLSYYCFKCGSHNLNFVFQKKLSVSKFKIDKLFLELETSPLISLPNIKGVPELEMIGDTLPSSHRKYLKKRGFNPDTIVNKYKITGTKQFPLDFSFRIIIPIFQNKKLVSYMGRDITGQSDIRYKILPVHESVIPHNNTLYGLQFAKGKQIAVVEGIFDQWNMGDGFVACYGSSLSDMQLYILSQYETVFFIFDSDAMRKAKKSANQLAMLNHKINVEYIDLQLPEEMDAGDLSDNDVRIIRKELNFMI